MKEKQIEYFKSLSFEDKIKEIKRLAGIISNLYKTTANKSFCLYVGKGKNNASTSHKMANHNSKLRYLADYKQLLREYSSNL